MQAYLILNQDCNLNCQFCIRGNRRMNERLELNDLSIVLRNNDFSRYHVLLSGGEPTLHPHLPEIIEMCKPHFCGISINTNGTNSSWITKCKCRDFHVQISLDGTRIVHNSLRGNGTLDVYRKVSELIAVLNSERIPYNISSIVGHTNYENIKALCHEISGFQNIRYWKVSPELPFGCAGKNDVISISEWNSLVEYLLNHADIPLKVKKLYDFQLLDKYMLTHPDFRRFPKSNCGSIKYKIYIYPDFTVYPCTCLTDFPLGNLLTTRLKDILQGPTSQKFINYCVLPESRCYSCKYLPVCNGGCIGMSYHYYNKIGMGDFRCPFLN